jgi:hypothetical protein
MTLNTCYLLSEALRAAAASVVKRGLPRPEAMPPKMTTLALSRWLIAFRLMYGSATSCIVRLVCTRVATPIFSSEACSNMAFMTDAIMLKDNSYVGVSQMPIKLKQKAEEGEDKITIFGR